MTVWVLTDGKAGDESQCLGIVEALGLSPEIRRVAPRPPWLWLMPWGPVDPREGPSRPDSPIAPPWPDLVVASGRRAVPYVRAAKRASGGRTFTVILKDPRTGPGAADLLWAPDYDRVRGPNVVTTLTSPHRMSVARLAAARAAPDPRVAALRSPRVAVLVGGDSRHGALSADEAGRLASGLSRLAEDGAALMITSSRRTPAALRDRLAKLAAGSGGFAWDGAGENPYPSLLAVADAIVVTSDSVNMLSEAVAAEAPVLLFEIPTSSRRHRAFVHALRQAGAVRPFDEAGTVLAAGEDRLRTERLDSTPVIAQAIADGIARHRARLGLP